jgi:hypothetical protein
VRTLVALGVAGVLLLAASGGYARATSATWNGSWDTEWGLMKLTQSGTSLTGTYPHDHGRISGTVSGAHFKGRWNEAPTRKGPGDAGAVEFTMSADGKRLTGRWNYDGSPTAWHTDWNGTCTAGLCLANTSAPGGGGTAPAAGGVEPKVYGTDWADTARFLRGKPGTFVFVCPAAGRKDQVWGTDVYTDTSSVCTAALHDGAFGYDNGGIVTIRMLPGRAAYSGSVRNGITSVDWGAWPGSFEIVSAVRGSDVPGVKMGGAGWTASATRFRGRNGGRYRYLCPGNAGLGSVYGTNTYTDDSSPCAAAVQLGLFTRSSGGRVTIQIAPRLAAYQGTTANGISSQPSTAALGSFTIPGAPVLPPGGGGGGGGGTTTTGGGGGAAAPATGTATGTVTVNGVPFTNGTIPIGATVDVTNGRLRLVTSTGTLTVSGAGVSASFKLVRGTDRKKPVTELRLVKGNFAVCPRRKPRGSAATATVVRQLWGDGKGAFRTRGRFAAATVRGTNWLTADRCDGTFVRVRQGVIEVNDLPKRRLVTVRAPRTYLATP